MSNDMSWNELRTHVTPKWFRDAKFGIYTHWGIYSVPACGPNGTWYPYNMYRENTSQHEHHLRTYGSPSKFGYKDFIPQFTGENFDPDHWADLFKEAGAQFAGPVGEHHDGFCMWDTDLTNWNAMKMGPKRDVVAELERAIRAKGMRFMMALHHAENWWFFPHWKEAFDTSDPAFVGLYGDPHDLDMDPETALTLSHSELWESMEKPSKKFLDAWYNKTREAIDRFHPDLLWFDFGINYIQEHYKRRMLEYYYKSAEKRNSEVVLTYKWNHLVPGSAVIDLELGRFNDMTYHDWITDTTVDDGQGWGYLSDTRYKSAESLIHYLVDNVSKNGHMLLNVGPKPNGEIPAEAVSILKSMGKWLSVNGEAIFGTTPWMEFGEGPTEMKVSGPFNEDQDLRYTDADFRFTTKGDALYAICLAVPEREIVLKTLPKRLYPSEIHGVEVLGSKEKLSWNYTREGLRVTVPRDAKSEHAMVFKISRKAPFETT